MARSQETFGKKEKEKKKAKKREEKAKRKEERRANSMKGEGFEKMISYVDEFGRLTDTPPDPSQKVEIEAEDIVLGIPKKEDVEEDPFRNGKIEFFNDEKGYGFIKDLDTQEKFFVHISGLIDDVRENDKVIFELERGMKGMNAVRVKLLK